MDDDDLYGNNNNMAYDDEQDAQPDSQEDEQTQTQSTQEASQSQSQPIPMDNHLWGYLQPCNAHGVLSRIDFWKIHPKYTIGRNTANQVVLPGPKVSNTHCVISWDGVEGPGSTIAVQDLSSNGTFINGTRIGKGQTKVLREGNEIAFGTAVPQIVNPLEDYRFIYRHVAGGPPTEGLYAKYDLGSELGKGSFATVRKAVNRETGKWYAVKMIHDGRTLRQNGDTKSNTFAREISIMEKLKHPNICELVEVFVQANNDINLVLELIDGGDLLEHILKNNGLSEVDTKHITFQMCDALAYIHSKGVAHRDLKPENVLLTTDRPPIVKIADFGLAKVVNSLTMLRTMCGTPNYLAPEVVKQKEQEGYDHLVDSWSVGVIVFSMITNTSPFIEDESQPSLQARIATRTIDWDTLHNSNPSAEALHFIRSLLQDDPRNRMSMSESLAHPWLTSYTLVYDLQRPDGGAYVPSSESFNMGGLDIRDQSWSQIDYAEAGPSKNRSTAPLQRRSLVLSQAAEGEAVIPEPTPDMVAYAESHEQDLLGQPVRATRAQKKNKRLHAEMSPLAEEGYDMGAESSGSGSKSSSNDSQAGKGARRSTRRTNKVARVK